MPGRGYRPTSPRARGKPHRPSPAMMWSELAGAGLPRELRRYSYLQLWVVVPLLLAVLALRQRRVRRGAS